jgi:hypothetical protein
MGMRVCACCRRQYMVGGWITASGLPACSELCQVVYDRRDDDDVGSRVFAMLNKFTVLPEVPSPLDSGLIKVNYEEEDFNIIFLFKKETPLTEDEKKAVVAPEWTFQELPGIACVRKDLVTGRKEDIGYWLVSSEDKEAVRKYCEHEAYQSWEDFDEEQNKCDKL